ncbi:MAG TPA: MmcQ/YjbR family DNA-binding protein [Pseudonocardiaceae bacterium]
MVDEALQQLRRICATLPEVSERLSHGSPAFFVRDRKTLVMLLDDHHGDGRLAIWCPAPEGVQATLVAAEPHRFFRPPYVGGRGWLGLRLDVEVDWAEVAAIIEDAFRLVAPKTLVRQWEAGR